MTKKYIVSRERYTNKANEEKSYYHRIGEIVTFPSADGDRQIIKLYATPSEKYYTQEPRDEENKSRGYTAPNKNTAVPMSSYPNATAPTNTTVQPEPAPSLPTINLDNEEEINIEDVPF